MMEVFLYNSNVCRLCGEENDNGSLLYSSEENNQNLSDIINAYLPIKVSDDGQLPRTICPGCTIQLEATVEFLNLIINGQKVIRALHEREKEYSNSVLKPDEESDVITENIVYEINTSDGVYQVEHPISLQVAGLEKPKRKRGRPPKKSKTPEELAAEAAAKERQAKSQKFVRDKEDSSSGKRRRKTPTRFKEVVQGAELERIFKEEGVTDGEESEPEVRRPPPAREPEVIGHLEASGELVLFVKGKGRGRPKGRMRQTREQCVICGMEFSCLGRYMSHVAQHGPVRYQCSCEQEFPKRLHFNDHQRETGHTGLTVIPCSETVGSTKTKLNGARVLPTKEPDKAVDLDVTPAADPPVVASAATGLPDLGPSAPVPKQELIEDSQDAISVTMTPPPGDYQSSAPVVTDPPTDPLAPDSQPPVQVNGKQKLKCTHCDKLFSNKQSKSLHIKAVHQGERPYACGECGAAFAYPRSLALHAVTHRRRRNPGNGYACDLCGKVLNHPSSVVYHKQAAHAAQQYVCGACGKRFRHKQLLQRHQLVHSQARPFSCKICAATFKTKANLLNHQLLHYGVKKFSCEICKHRFAHKTSLTLHMRWHSGVKPFSCEVCGKSFSQKGNLSEHERIHTGEKPYACAHCPRRFTTSSQHRLHTRRHLRARTKQPRRESLHKCNVCGWTGASRAALAQHAREAGHPSSAGRKQSQKQESLLVSERGPVAELPALPALSAPLPALPALAAPLPSLPALAAQLPALAAPLPALAAPLPALAAPLPVPPTPPAPPSEPEEERVIYVAYDMDDADSPAYHILDPEQGESLEESKALAGELYAGSSLLLSQQLGHDLDVDQQVEFQQPQHLPVTDEQGNPLHFTMQDGTRLAITSADGKSLQVITQDGQTIPVEINGFTDEDEMDPDTVVHQLNIQKGDEEGAPVTHYFTLV